MRPTGILRSRISGHLWMVWFLALVVVLAVGCSAATESALTPTSPDPGIPAATAIIDTVEAEVASPTPILLENDRASIPVIDPFEAALTSKMVNNAGQEFDLEQADVRTYLWQSWELDRGITGQAAHTFPNVETTREFFNLRLGALEAAGWTHRGRERGDGGANGAFYVFGDSESGFLGIGSNLNVLIEVRGETYQDTLDALLWLGDALCC